MSDNMATEVAYTGDFAEQIGIDWNIIVDIILEKEEAKITPELADAFEKALDIPTHV